MTPTEFKNEFNLLYNNIMSDMAPGLDDYEISVFLTQAQEELVQQLYSGAGNFIGFEANEKVRRNLANLIHNTVVDLTSYSPETFGNFLLYKIDLNAGNLRLLSERAEINNTDCCGNSKTVNVTPIKYDEINKVIENPFRRPNNRQVLRMDLSSSRIQLISKAIVTKYEYDWLAKPTPIIVEDLPTDFSIDGANNSSTSPLDDSLHRTIVKYAVQLAAASWASNNKN